MVVVEVRLQSSELEIHCHARCLLQILVRKVVGDPHQPYRARNQLQQRLHVLINFIRMAFSCQEEKTFFIVIPRTMVLLLDFHVFYFGLLVFC